MRITVAEVAKTFGVARSQPKVLATFATLDRFRDGQSRMSKHSDDRLIGIGVLIVVGCLLSGCGREPIAPTQPIDVTPVVPASVDRELPGNDPADETMLTNWTVGGVRPPTEAADRGDVGIHLALAGHDGYVESTTCTRCHADQAAGYARSAHARSLTPAVGTDPPGVLVDHEASGRRYDRIAVGNTMGLRESIELPTPPGTPPMRMAVNEWPVLYVMGSGEFATTEILGDGDDLMQSPVSWYRRAGHYAMSPGYDAVNQLGTNRAITDQCLACHVGSLRYVENLETQPVVVEHSIGCQRCHGPGESHNQYHDRVSAEPPAGAEKMFHPGRGDRRASESVCASVTSTASRSSAAATVRTATFDPATICLNSSCILTRPTILTKPKDLPVIFNRCGKANVMSIHR